MVEEKIRTYILTKKDTKETYVMTEKVFNDILTAAGKDKVEANFYIEVAEVNS